jgi:hypothetical protein
MIRTTALVQQSIARSIIGKGLPSSYSRSSGAHHAANSIKAHAAVVGNPSSSEATPCQYRTYIVSAALDPTPLVVTTSAIPSVAVHVHRFPSATKFSFERQRRLFSSASTTSFDLARHKRIIFTHALHHVHDDGWTDDAIASGTLDANLPPASIGMMGDTLSYSSSPSLGNADLVAFFMEECNETLNTQLLSSTGAASSSSTTTTSMTQDEYCNQLSSRIYNALHMRLCMVLPFVKSNRWHEGMAIGALPQNSIRTIQQLDNMATIVLNYALSSDSDLGMRGGEKSINNEAMVSRMPVTAQRTAIVAAYAATELHLLSDGNDGLFSTIGGKNASSLRGDEERYRDTWQFLEARSAEVARFIVDGGTLPFPLSSASSLPHPTHVITAASAVASSLAGAALSLASPVAAAAVAGQFLPNSQSALTSAFAFVENVVRGSATQQPAAMGGAATSTRRGDGTRPSDYTAETTNLPPFDTTEEIFSGGGIARK